MSRAQGSAGATNGQDGRYDAGAWKRRSDDWPGWPVCRGRSDGVTLQRSKGPSLAHPASILTLVAFGESSHRYESRLPVAACVTMPVSLESHPDLLYYCGRNENKLLFLIIL